MTIHGEAAELFKAHCAAAIEFGAIEKAQEGFNYRYADLAAVRAATIPVLTKHGLTIIQEVTSQDPETVAVTTTLGHVSGAYAESTAVIKVGPHKGMSDEQRAGTAITYQRRYSWLAACGLAPEDTDAAPDRKTVAPKLSKAPKPPRPAGNPPTIEGKPITAMPPELLVKAAKGHPNQSVKKWAAFFVAGGQA